MQHRINPTMDTAFDALLGAEDDRALLVHVFNAVLDAEFSAPTRNGHALREGLHG